MDNAKAATSETNVDENSNNRFTPSLLCSIGSETTSISDNQLRNELYKFLDFLQEQTQVDDVLLIPPDYTRFHSQAGKVTKMITQYYNIIPSSADEGNNAPKSTPNILIMPALGTHTPMTKTQIKSMFGPELAQMEEPSPFLVHDWRNDVETIGYVPKEMVDKATNGYIKNKAWPAQLNKIVWAKRKDVNKKKSIIISIGQVVPHEVMGMANYNKNLFVGVGGIEAINLSHFIGAIYGMENMMGRSNNPLRSILNYASTQYLETQFDNLWYILTVIGTNAKTQQTELKGLYIGNSIDCYNHACELSLKVNFTLLDKPPKKMVVYLDENEFHSTWLGNKAIYRTRMAIADDGELIILAQGIRKFGEDDQVDEIIRKYGYVGTPQIMKYMEQNYEELQDSLGAVAHLIHGSTEGRFTVTYCPGHLTKDEIENVGFQYASLGTMSQKYDINKLKDGWNTDSETAEDFFFIRNPALGLWAVESRFQNKDEQDDDDKKELVSKKPRIEE